MPCTHTGRADSLGEPAPAQASENIRARQFAAHPDPVADPRLGDSAPGTDAHGGAASPGSLGEPSPAQAPKTT